MHMNLNYELIGSRIHTKRESMGYTREQLAELLDISPKFCSDIELGLRGMSLNTLVNISNTLYLSTDYILFGTETAKDSSPFMFLVNQIPEKYYDSAIPILEQIIKIINLKTNGFDS